MKKVDDKIQIDIKNESNSSRKKQRKPKNDFSIIEKIT